jgi:hypothetical protein
MAIRIRLRPQLDLFAVANQPTQLSADDRLKALALLQSLLIEAISGQAIALSTHDGKEAGNDQDYA